MEKDEQKSQPMMAAVKVVSRQARRQHRWPPQDRKPCYVGRFISVLQPALPERARSKQLRPGTHESEFEGQFEPRNVGRYLPVGRYRLDCSEGTDV